MTNSQVLFRNILLNDLRGVKGINPKALAEILLLRVHYGKAADNYYKSLDAITKEEEADEAAKKEAVEKLYAEEADVADKKLSVAAFGQVVEAVSAQETINAGFLADKDGNPVALPAEDWLTTFAANLVDCGE